jgi:hypothetical protein
VIIWTAATGGEKDRVEVTQAVTSECLQVYHLGNGNGTSQHKFELFQNVVLNPHKDLEFVPQMYQSKVHLCRQNFKAFRKIT